MILIVYSVIKVIKGYIKDPIESCYMSTYIILKYIRLFNNEIHFACGLIDISTYKVNFCFE